MNCSSVCPVSQVFVLKQSLVTLRRFVINCLIYCCFFVADLSEASPADAPQQLRVCGRVRELAVSFLSEAEAPENCRGGGQQIHGPWSTRTGRDRVCRDWPAGTSIAGLYGQWRVGRGANAGAAYAGCGTHQDPGESISRFLARSGKSWNR